MLNQNNDEILNELYTHAANRYMEKKAFLGAIARGGLNLLGRTASGKGALGSLGKKWWGGLKQQKGVMGKGMYIGSTGTAGYEGGRLAKNIVTGKNTYQNNINKMKNYGNQNPQPRMRKGY